jgi:hypothetical protein
MLSFDETGLATGRIRPINAGNVIETHKHAGDFGWLTGLAIMQDRFWRALIHFNLRVYFLDLRGLLFETCGKRLNFP